MPNPAAIETGRHALAISGMTCGGCVGAVERVLSRVPGVTGVKVDLSAGQAVIEGSAGVSELIAAVERAGYDAEPLAVRTIT